MKVIIILCNLFKCISDFDDNRFMIVKETRQPDKTAIKEALKSWRCDRRCRISLKPKSNHKVREK